MRHLALTVDYELFGNGTGDVVQHVTGPTERMAALCRQHSVPLTVFFEAEEYLAFERHAEELKRSWGHDPARLIREQLAALAGQGHDIQLHLHPQWVGARFENGGWVLRPDQETVDGLFASQEEVTAYIGERKAVIERLVAPSAPGRTVRAYRAGAFAAQPGRKLLSALAHHGIVIDSSVVNGLQRKDDHVCLDYRKVPAGRQLWRVREDVAVEDRTGPLWEVPIHSVPRRRFQQATFSRLKAKFSKNVPREQQRRMVQQLGVGRGLLPMLRFLLQRVPIKLDFHNLSPRTLLRWIKAAPADPSAPLDVLVLIGHTKEHLNDRAFGEFLAWVKREPGLEVVSLDRLADLLATART
ncbi:MAG: hypothetical protein HZA90_27390 [Verrucomicrobia bacterium]|nr:hypothetical protein [Verrucomicrobiota bacterium]